MLYRSVQQSGSPSPGGNANYYTAQVTISSTAAGGQKITCGFRPKSIYFLMKGQYPVIYNADWNGAYQLYKSDRWYDLAFSAVGNDAGIVSVSDDGFNVKTSSGIGSYSTTVYVYG